MNYIHHLNSFFHRVEKDQHLTPYHIGLYMALFQKWNRHQFKSTFTIYREELMRYAKIGSKDTYYKCMRELHQQGYILYLPAPCRYTPVKVSMPVLYNVTTPSPQLPLFEPVNISPGSGTLQVPDSGYTSTISGTYSVPDPGHFNKTIINNYKNSEPNGPAPAPQQAQHSPGLTAVIAFFRLHHYPAAEAEKFWLYYEATGWKTGSGAPIQNWQALAHKWMLNPVIKNVNPNTHEHLHTNTDKDYSEPL